MNLDKLKRQFVPLKKKELNYLINLKVTYGDVVSISNINSLYNFAEDMFLIIKKGSVENQWAPPYGFKINLNDKLEVTERILEEL